MLNGQEAFLSEENIKKHKEHLENLRIRYSVIEVCNKNITGKGIKELSKIRFNDNRDELLDIKSRILCHELFFNSFSVPYQTSNILKKKYRSEASFLYEIYEKGRKMDFGYIVLYIYRGNVEIFYGNAITELFLKTTPILCIDMYEHSYYQDYGFDRDIYLKNALAYLNLSKVDKFFHSKD